MTWLRYFLWILAGVEWMMAPLGQAIALWGVVYGFSLWSHMPLAGAATLATGVALYRYHQFQTWEF